MDKKEILLDLGFEKENENTFFKKLTKERKLIVDINMVGSVGDAIHIQQYDDVCFLCYFTEEIIVSNLINILK